MRTFVACLSLTLFSSMALAQGQGKCAKVALYAAVGAAQGAYEGEVGNVEASFSVYPSSYYANLLSQNQVGKGNVETYNVHAISTGAQSLMAVVSVFEKKGTCHLSNIEMM